MPNDDARRLLSPRDAGELRWYFREASGALSGVEASGYEPTTGKTEYSSSDAVVRAFERSRAVRRLGRLERARDALGAAPQGPWHWMVLRLVHGWPRREDPWQDFAREPELAPLVRHSPTLRAAGLRAALREGRAEAIREGWMAEHLHELEREKLRDEGGSPMAAAGRLIVLLDRPGLAPDEDEVGRFAVRAWEIASRGQKHLRDALLCARVKAEARTTYEGAAEAWRGARASAARAERPGAFVPGDLEPLGESSSRLLAAAE